MKKRILDLFFILMAACFIGCSSQQYQEKPLEESDAEILIRCESFTPPKRTPTVGEIVSPIPDLKLIVDWQPNPTLQNFPPKTESGRPGIVDSRQIVHNGKSLVQFYAPLEETSFTSFGEQELKEQRRKRLFEVELRISKIFGYEATIRIYKQDVKAIVSGIYATDDVSVALINKKDDSTILRIAAPTVIFDHAIDRSIEVNSQTLPVNSLSAQFVLTRVITNDINTSGNLMLMYLKYPLDLQEQEWRWETTSSQIQGSFDKEWLVGFKADKIQRRENDDVIPPKQGERAELNAIATMQGNNVSAQIVFLDAGSQVILDPDSLYLRGYLFMNDGSNRSDFYRGLVNGQHFVFTSNQGALVRNAMQEAYDQQQSQGPLPTDPPQNSDPSTPPPGFQQPNLPPSR